MAHQKEPKKDYRRKLEVTKSGYWYLALIIAMGVVALATGNNIIYLIESMLMGGFILSGVFSEKAVASIDFAVMRRQATAGEQTKDVVKFHNSSRYSVFSIELGEWINGRFEPVCFLPLIEPKSSVTVNAPRLFERRGIHSWDGLAIATAGPFGFARKIRPFRLSEQRTIWPKGIQQSGKDRSDLLSYGIMSADSDVRPMTYDDDARDIVWKLSSKGIGHIVRNRRAEKPELKLQLDLNEQDGERFELNISRIAQALYDFSDSALDAQMTVIGTRGKRTIKGKRAILDFLSVVQSEVA